jgi:hypothetical protein
MVTDGTISPVNEWSPLRRRGDESNGLVEAKATLCTGHATRLVNIGLQESRWIATA